MLRALGHVAAVVHSEFEGAVGVRAGEVSVDCCHSKENGSSPEIEANSSGRISTCISGSEVASRDPARTPTAPLNSEWTIAAT